MGEKIQFLITAKNLKALEKLYNFPKTDPKELKASKFKILKK